jgi:hypothetical protein
MKILSFLLLTLSLNLFSQEKPYHVVTCFSDSEGWIDVLINKQQPNDQMLRIYTQGGLGPNSLEASYVSVGNNNQLKVEQDGSIQLIANFSGNLKLTIEYSVATLSSNLNTQATTYRHCRFE